MTTAPHGSVTASRPMVLPLNHRAIPQDLLDETSWVGWRWAERGGRWIKEPIGIRTGRLARTDDSGAHVTRACALQHYQEWPCDGIGVFKNGGFVTFPEMAMPETRICGDLIEEPASNRRHSEAPTSPNDPGLIKSPPQEVKADLPLEGDEPKPAPHAGEPP